MNTWFYDGIMPEYMANNHEQLSGAGTNFGEWVQFQGTFWRRFLPYFFGLFLVITTCTCFFPNVTVAEKTNTMRRLLKDIKKEKIGMRPDWMGTSKPQ